MFANIGRRPFAWAAMVAVCVTLLSAPSFGSMGSGSENLGATQVQPSTASQPARVLPPIFTPYGYSLARMAKTTAFFNTTDREGNPPQTPFALLYTSASNTNNSFDVPRGTMLYVPVLFNDNSPPVIGGESNFPASNNRRAVLNYFFGMNKLGVRYAEIVVDGTVYSLASDYLVQVNVPKLGDGSGTRYQTIAAFITPLSKGTHQIEIRAKATGAALKEPPFDQFFPGGVFEFSTVYTVNVQ